jgi:phosphodiesterase/alkaline phosphatase D-like protein
MERTLADLSVAELRLRLAILEKIMREAQSENDDRWKGLEPDRQALLQVIGSKTIPPVVVKLKTAVMSASSNSRRSS